MEQLLQKLASIEVSAATQCNYMKTLALLQALKDGSVSLDEVSMTDNGWTVAAVAPTAEPAPPAPPEQAEEPEELPPPEQPEQPE